MLLCGKPPKGGKTRNGQGGGPVNIRREAI